LASKAHNVKTVLSRLGSHQIMCPQGCVISTYLGDVTPLC
jgi:hypothetical protein